MMGSDTGEPEESPTHEVTVETFYICKYPVTQKLWRKITGKNPSHYRGDSRPVEQICWYDAIRFCNSLSRLEGLLPVYRGKGRFIKWNPNANGYRLPSEAEWEFAAKGGVLSRGYKFSGSDILDKVAWNKNNIDKVKTQNVGMKNPNELGIYDLSGNVWEWCWDAYISYCEKNRSMLKTGRKVQRVARGGNIMGTEYECRVTARGNAFPVRISNSIGLRLVRTP